MSMDMMWLYMKTQLLSGPPWIMTWDLTVDMFMLASGGMMEHGKRHRN